jgi:hypothetical protein
MIRTEPKLPTTAPAVCRGPIEPCQQGTCARCAPIVAVITKDEIPEYGGICTLEDGTEIEVRVIPDESMGPPWEEYDGHGPVSEWTTRDKHPGELVLARDRGASRYYDFSEAVKIARRDGWGTAGRTPGERAARATLEDFNRLRDWCEDRWSWVGVEVTVRRDGTEESESLWGIESDGDYWKDVAAELANGILTNA